MRHDRPLDTELQPNGGAPVERLHRGAPLDEVDAATLYGGDERGYVDYATLDQLVA